MATLLENIFLSARRHARRHLVRGDDLIFASMPKSASQYLERLLLAGLGDNWRAVRGKYTNGGSQMFQSAHVMRREIPMRRRALCYGHMLYCDHNRRVWTGLVESNRAIVTIRNLPDALLSYREHVDEKGTGPLDLRIEPDEPEGFANWSELSDAQKNDYLVGFVAPWYLTFLDGWLAAREAGWTIAILQYEEVIRDPADVVLDGLRQIGQTANVERLSQAVGVRRNFNKGVVGRGRHAFDPGDLQRLRWLAEIKPRVRQEPGLLDYLIGEMVEAGS